MVEFCSCRRFTFLPLLLTLLSVVHCQLGRFALYKNDVIDNRRPSTWSSLADDIHSPSEYSRPDSDVVYDTDAPPAETSTRIYSMSGCCLLPRVTVTQPGDAESPLALADCEKRCKRLPHTQHYSSVADKKLRSLLKRRAPDAGGRDMYGVAAQGEMVTYRKLLYDVIGSGQAYWLMHGSETTKKPVYLSPQPSSTRRRTYKTKFRNVGKSWWKNVVKDGGEDGNLRSVTTSKSDVGNGDGQQQHFDDELTGPLSIPPSFDSEDVVVSLRFGQERKPDGAVKVDGLFESRRSSPSPGVGGSNAGDRGGGGNIPDKLPTAMSLRLALDAIAGLVQDRTNTGSGRFLTSVSGDDGGLGAGLDLGATHEKTSKYDRLTSIG